MNRISIKLENCYGIGKLEKELDVSSSNTVVIYAPNGTMKTSFANTFDCMAKGTAPTDRLYKDRSTNYTVTADGIAIASDAILVVNAEDDIDGSNSISSFLASKELKEQYDTIYSELNSSKAEFVKKLKAISLSTDCENEFVSTFTTKQDSTFFTLLVEIREKLSDSVEKFHFRYNDIFDKKGNVKKFLEKNNTLLAQYFEQYQDLISHSKFFKKLDDTTFGTLQANEIIKSTNDNTFFLAGHKLVLDGGVDIDSAQQLKDFVENEIQKVTDDVNLKQTFGKVDKAIGANAELRDFKTAIEKNNLLLIKLNDYESFKKQVWIGYFSELLPDVETLIAIYNSKKDELEVIIEKAKQEHDIWISIIDLFNSRFYVPFKVKLTNQEDIILKQETANLEFEYTDQSGNPPVTKDKIGLLNILSKGERRAYYILQLLFDIEAKKSSGIESLLIFDDIADSFDYKNKYAIIEYLKDITESNFFKSIILTHNFDFYRTVSSRLNLNKSVFMAVKNVNREIELIKGEYRRDIFNYFIKKIDDPKIFISLIPFVRNIVEYTKGTTSNEYEMLTGCLHIKEASTNISTDKILELYQSTLRYCNNNTINFLGKNITYHILEIADNILEESSPNEILLENKIVLAIAIRLSAEIYMKKNLSEFDLKTIAINQTRVLFDEYKKKNTQSKTLLILDRVNLMTPENIHINAFMYEPLIDMSLNHLACLYHDIKNL